MKSVKEQLTNFLEPESILVIGASRTTGPGSFNIFEKLVKSDYPGEVYPLNPKADEILGKKAYNSVKEIDSEIDLAIVSTPRTTVTNIVNECVEMKIPAVIIISQGFSDAGEKGKRMEENLSDIAKNSNTRILGPNTLGVQNFYNGLSTAFYPIQDEIWKSMSDWKSVSLVSQTGLFFRGVPSVYFGKIIDIGNSCDIDHLDALKYLKEDPETELIFLHVEGVDRGKDFLEFAKDVCREKPVLSLKTGRSKKGAEMAASHTGSMTGEDRVYDGVFKQTGITRINGLRELEIFTKSFLNFPKMEGNNIAVLTTTGAAGIITADAIEEFGLKLADLSKETIETLDSIFPEWMEIKNPLDMWPAMMIGGEGIWETYSKTLKSVLKDDSVDGIVSIAPLGETPGEDQDILDETVNGLNYLLQNHEKPVAVWLIHEKANNRKGKELMKVKNLAVFDQIKDAVKALSFTRNKLGDLKCGIRGS